MGAVDAVSPDPLSRKQVRVGEAERLIRHYRLSTGDQAGVVDLMLAMVEAGTEQAVDLGYADEAYFAALERVSGRSSMRFRHYRSRRGPPSCNACDKWPRGRVDRMGLRRRGPRDHNAGTVTTVRTPITAPRSH